MANIMPFERWTVQVVIDADATQSGVTLSTAIDFDERKTPTCSLMVSTHSGGPLVCEVLFSEDDATYVSSSSVDATWTHTDNLSVMTVIRNTKYRYMKLEIDGTAALAGVYALSKHRRFPASLDTAGYAHIADAETIDTPSDHLCTVDDTFPFCFPFEL